MTSTNHADKIAALTATAQGLRFGIEIETFGLGIKAAAKVIALVVGGHVSRVGGYYNKHSAVMPDGREWQTMSDASISGRAAAEVVSPILSYSDMGQLQEIVRSLRKAGAKVNDTTGIHIHIDGAPFLADAKATRNLAKLVNQQEALMIKAFDADESRITQWAKSIDDDFVSVLDSMRKPTIAKIREAWYKHNGRPRYISQSAIDERTRQRYDGSRYQGMNFHSLFMPNRGTIEFRYFDGTLHAGKIKAYIQFLLHLCAKGLTAKAAASRKATVKNQNTKYLFRTFMLRLGLIGDEYKTCRLHLTKNLSGDSAYSGGR